LKLFAIKTGIFFSALLIFQSCGLSKLATDELMVAGIRNKESTVIDAAKFSIGVTYNSSIRNFASAGIKDSMMRKKIESLGSEVFVKYLPENDPGSIPDSTVIFTSYHDFGKVEIIFDFGTQERDIPQLITEKKRHHIKKVSARTYYRRGPEPY
jgi:hypothetical protein